MNTVNFFGHQVSKLIIGDNPFNGHSYIYDYVPRAEMLEFHTTDKILEAMFEMQKYGYNTMLPLADPYIIRVLKEFENSGGKMQYIFQPYMPMRQDVSMRQMLDLQGTIGIYHQGTTTDYNFETGKKDLIIKQIEEYHSMGIPVGVGTHRTDVIETSEREGWNVDFYVRCMYNARRNREGVESGFLTGKSKQGLQFRPDDRAEVLASLQNITKPVIAYKIFAGGQMLVEKTPEEKRAAIKDAYNTVFNALKPDDFAAIGVFQKYGNQIKEDAEIYEEWYSEQQGK